MLQPAELTDAPGDAPALARDLRESRSSLRHRLREATSADHARLDATLSALDLQSRDGYRVFLEINAAALWPLEEALVRSGVTRLFPDWHRRSRRAALMRDLRQLDGAIRPLPDPARMDEAAIFGTLYVLEGSRLGARFLVRSVAASPDPLVAATTAYLRHGEGEGLWPAFLTLLEQHAPDHDRAVAAAKRAFALFAEAAAA
jgi:heme oxygenase